ncbi:embryo sac development arrest protein [Parasponia andersonii]|uniref:Embryo sac development arrest protein n=1 Tax=Parasponia andersonii TaxID=3476 RepID=A0A2P5AMP8_PARAD|nr:embryo sac development arrest protein [Parasponia andersonii]
MSYNSRRILTPGAASRKRKEREAFYSLKSSTPPLPPSASAQAAAKKPAVPKADEPASSNRLLACYMAYEFLTNGTLFGQKFDPARAEAVPVGGSSSAESRKPKLEAEPIVRKEHQSYSEVASILKTDGAHIPGIVNPTQLARWIQM